MLQSRCRLPRRLGTLACMRNLAAASSPPALARGAERHFRDYPAGHNKSDAKTHSRHCFRDAREYYRSGFDFHSTASFCASAICAGVICCATRFRLLIASWSLRAAAKLSHMYA